MQKTPQTPQQVKEYFNNLSKTWFESSSMTNYYYKLATDYALIREGDFEDKVVLNEGCFLPIDELNFAPFSREWYGIDFSLSVIEKGNKIISQFGLEKKVKLQCKNICDTGFASNFFDTILSLSTIDHLTDHTSRLQAMNETYRILKPGGIFILTVPAANVEKSTSIFTPGGDYYQFTRKELVDYCGKFSILAEVQYKERFGFRLTK